VADFDNEDAAAAALAGVGRAYLVTPSSERAQAQQEGFVDLAAKAGVQHLVKLSQLAADETSPVRFLRYHAAVEQRIRDQDIGFTFLRPNLFFQGLLPCPARSARTANSLPRSAMLGSARSTSGTSPPLRNGSERTRP